MSIEHNLPKFFDFKNEEDKIYKLWEENQVFKGVIDKTKEPFCVVIPPPNVTGILHMGHVLDNTAQDIMVRWHRMRGFAALWVPGTDHAGIATQNIVERELKKEGLTKYDLGREKFLEKVWEWKAEKGGKIINQLKRLGASCDWSRLRFTMDEGLTKAVRKAFVTYYKKGLIYRGEKMINWCPRCKTALANDEVEHQERKGNLWHLKYPIADSKGNPTDEYIVVATTRPETMLGDMAVAVNPKDERYFNLHGKKVLLPVKNRLIPIICDEFVDKEFGTGLVKVTPAHDPNDYEMGLKHGLEVEKVIGEDGKMTSCAGEFEGMTREEARDAVVKKMQELGLVEKIEDYKHSVGECYKCHTIIEPYVSLQWFLDMQDLAKEVKKIVEDEKIKVTPESEKNDFYTWLDNIRDWCISRQLWWGHRIPVFYCEDCGEIMCEEEDVTECTKCKSHNIKQDPDVLDTWFSSQLWPFSTLGWPEETADLKFWFPTSWLICGRDIIFFWGARMMTASHSLMHEVPFKKLVLHGLVRDSQGRKMSKSLGNYVDPIEIFDKYGVDAVRASVLPRYPLGRQDCKIGERNYEEGQSLITKLWNATKLVFMSLSEDKFVYNSKELKLKEAEDRWIVSRLREIIIEHDKYLAESNFARAFSTVNQFFFSDYCDWYLEIIKQRLRGSEETKKRVLEVVFFIEKNILKLFHPYIPFITESLWQNFKRLGVIDTAHSEKEDMFITTSKWPEVSEFEKDSAAESIISIVQGAVGALRNFKQTLNLPLKMEFNLTLKVLDKNLEKYFLDFKDKISALINVSKINFLKEDTLDASFIPLAFDGGICYVEKPSELDIEDVKAKLTSKIEKLNKQKLGLEAKLGNESFVKNAPEELVASEQKNLAELKESVGKLEAIIKVL
ncbi:MAG: valine--tRNA ligase [Bdellovibrionota bacterium]|nr:valine--tRNA ligase [Pseudomonadota bacterium]MDY6090460.1 valine--tRNA ligase [Bdellovibrionota bacterium]